MNNNITLIGMPGSGKSTIGVLLAKKLGYSFLDTDILIQEKTGKLLKDIIAEEGIEGFKRLENLINSHVSVSNTVIAPGGSVIYGADAMANLKNIGKVVYLMYSFPTIAERIGDPVSRGVVLRPGQTLKNLYDERVILYAKYADITVECDDLDISGVLGKVCASLQRNGFSL